MAGEFLRGAFVQFMDTFLMPVPNVIVFQFNPESISHSWSPQAEASDEDETNSLAVRGEPKESFQFTLAMDSSDMIAEGSAVAETIAIASGVYSRLAALEMLMQPVVSEEDSLLASMSSAAGSGDEEERSIPEYQLPVVLFVWGPGRILPVKITSLSITETIYDRILLHPTHAEASVQVEVLKSHDLMDLSGPLTGIARAALSYSQTVRKGLATANLANSVESIIGMLPV